MHIGDAFDLSPSWPCQEIQPELLQHFLFLCKSPQVAALSSDYPPLSWWLLKKALLQKKETLVHAGTIRRGCRKTDISWGERAHDFRISHLWSSVWMRSPLSPSSRGSLQRRTRNLIFPRTSRQLLYQLTTLPASSVELTPGGKLCSGVLLHMVRRHKNNEFLNWL